MKESFISKLKLWGLIYTFAIDKVLAGRQKEGICNALADTLTEGMITNSGKYCIIAWTSTERFIRQD